MVIKAECSSVKRAVVLEVSIKTLVKDCATPPRRCRIDATGLNSKSPRFPKSDQLFYQQFLFQCFAHVSHFSLIHAFNFLRPNLSDELSMRPAIDDASRSVGSFCGAPLCCQPHAGFFSGILFGVLLMEFRRVFLLGTDG